jgi:hypothetical protein
MVLIKRDYINLKMIYTWFNDIGINETNNYNKIYYFNVSYFKTITQTQTFRMKI